MGYTLTRDHFLPDPFLARMHIHTLYVFPNHSLKHQAAMTQAASNRCWTRTERSVRLFRLSAIHLFRTSSIRASWSNPQFRKYSTCLRFPFPSMDDPSFLVIHASEVCCQVK